MPDWLIALVSIASSAVVSGVIGYLIKRTLDKYFQKKDKETAEKEEKLVNAEKLLEEKKQEQLEQAIDKVVEKHTDPIDNDLKGIKEKLGKVADGTLDTLRDRILSCYYKCLEKGFRTQYDIDNVDHMYKDYLGLDGNTFVADCVKKFNRIPTEEEWKILKGNRTKKPRKPQLLETKK